MPHVAWQPGGGLLAIADDVSPSGAVLRLFDPAPGKLSAIALATVGFAGTAWAPDGASVALVTGAGELVVVDLEGTWLLQRETEWRGVLGLERRGMTSAIGRSAPSCSCTSRRSSRDRGGRGDPGRRGVGGTVVPVGDRHGERAHRHRRPRGRGARGLEDGPLAADILDLRDRQLRASAAEVDGLAAPSETISGGEIVLRGGGVARRAEVRLATATGAAAHVQLLDGDVGSPGLWLPLDLAD